MPAQGQGKGLVSRRWGRGMPPPASDILWALDPTARGGEGGRELPCSLCNQQAAQKEPLKETVLERRRGRETGKRVQPTLFSLDTEI